MSAHTPTTARAVALGSMTVAAAILTTMLAGIPAEARQHDHQSDPAAPKTDQSPAPQPSSGRMMMMTGDHRTADARLQSLMDTMKSATGNDARIDAMVAVIGELVSQRAAMQAHMDSCSMMKAAHQ